MVFNILFRTFALYKHYLMTKFQEEVLKLLKENFSVREIAKKLNRSDSSVSSVRTRFGIKNYKQLNYNYCNHTYFDIIDTEEKAYLLGFFIADGYIMSNEYDYRFGIQIQEQDNYILKKYLENIIPNGNIKTCNKSTKEIKRVNISSLRWSSKYMKNIFINKYKILPNKTQDSDFKFPFETIPNYLIRHFVRGFIDGDGSFEQKDFIFTITLISTSENFLKNLASYICNLDNGIGIKVKKNKGKTIDWFYLRFNFFTNKKEKVTKIYDYLYKDATIFLQRKKDKIEAYLKYRGKL